MSRRSLTVLILVLVLALLPGCGRHRQEEGPRPKERPRRSERRNNDAIKKEGVLVVGRVELIPTLEKGEQKLNGVYEKFVGKMVLFTGDEWRVIKGEPGQRDFKDRIDAQLGKTFFEQRTKKSFYILTAVYWLDVGYRRKWESAYFPAGLRIDVRDDDKAVYIGTLRYQRNEFNQPVKFEIVDEYDDAKAEYEAQYGDGARLRKAIARSVKGDGREEGPAAYLPVLNGCRS